MPKTNRLANEEYPGLSFEDMIRVLQSLNIPHYVSFNKKDLKHLKRNAIVVVDYNDSPKKIGVENSRHAVIWNCSNRSIVDPIPKYKRKIKVTEKYCLKNFSFLIEIG